MEMALDVNWLRWLLATGVVACMLFALYLFTLKFGNAHTKTGQTAKIQITERHRLTPKHTLIYGTIDHTPIALLLGPHGDTQIPLPSQNPTAKSNIKPKTKAKT